MKYFRYVIYLLIAITLVYFLTEYVATDQNILGYLISFVIVVVIMTSLLSIEVLKFQKKPK